MSIPYSPARGRYPNHALPNFSMRVHRENAVLRSLCVGLFVVCLGLLVVAIVQAAQA